MTAGSCVVATPTGGVVEQIEHGVSGLLAAEISGPALSAVLLRALHDSELPRHIGAAARARAVRDFDETLFLISLSRSRPAGRRLFGPMTLRLLPSCLPLSARQGNRHVYSGHPGQQ